MQMQLFVQLIICEGQQFVKTGSSETLYFLPHSTSCNFDHFPIMSLFSHL